MKLNSVDTSKIDELPAKVDQLFVNNQNQVFIMEESTSEQNAKDAAPEIDKPAEDHQENNQQTAPIITTAPHDELKSLAMMMQQLLQGQQVQGKALNQVTTNINAKMNNMFKDLSTKYGNVVSHMRQMDIQIAQTAESVKKQQGALLGKGGPFKSGVGSRVGDGFMKKRCHIWRISRRTARQSSLTIVPPSKEQYERLFSTFKETSKLFQEFALAAPLLL
ncbi:hypothetical protein DY000_02048076 [Brassica cretica]|uniref:Syntaxin N-terminal domain-containing protein n=1 Tax=Brassica cretica TaxID=69181 RepID=A0ABQ7EU93_BRACR|nr:hypothetical protein DY000_02048076 [Brassica cretica]